MTANAAQFVGSIPQFYHEGLGPCVFAGYAKDMARRVAVLNPGDVLELAAGTGIVTGAMREVLRADAKLVATDLNTPMLDFARAKLRFDDGVEFRQADAMALPFNSGMFNVVVCQFGVMFFPGKVQAFSEAARVLKPGGRYLFSVWSRMDANPFAQIAHETIGSFFTSDPPQFYRVPFGYSDPDQIIRDVRAGGFASVHIEPLPLQSPVASLEQFARGLVFGNPVIEEIRARGTATPEAVAEAVRANLVARLGPEPMRMPLRALIVEAHRA